MSHRAVRVDSISVEEGQATVSYTAGPHPLSNNPGGLGTTIDLANLASYDGQDFLITEILNEYLSNPAAAVGKTARVQITG